MNRCCRWLIKFAHSMNPVNPRHTFSLAQCSRFWPVCMKVIFGLFSCWSSTEESFARQVPSSILDLPFAISRSSLPPFIICFFFSQSMASNIDLFISIWWWGAKNGCKWATEDKVTKRSLSKEHLHEHFRQIMSPLVTFPVVRMPQNGCSAFTPNERHAPWCGSGFDSPGWASESWMWLSKHEWAHYPGRSMRQSVCSAVWCNACRQWVFAWCAVSHNIQFYSDLDGLFVCTFAILTVCCNR